MNTFFRRQKPNIRTPSGAFDRLQIFRGILNWLAGLIRFTEEEQKDAGVYLGE
jgi:hypothetical protein